MARGRFEPMAMASLALLLLPAGGASAAASRTPRALPLPAEIVVDAAALAGDESLNRIVESVQRRYRARVVKVTEITLGGRRAYELRLLSEQRVWTIRVDAESGQELPAGG